MAPTTPLRPVRSEAATGLGPAYPSSSAARSTRSTVAGATLEEPANASDAVDGETPARAATVLSVARSAIALPPTLDRIDLTG